MTIPRWETLCILRILMHYIFQLPRIVWPCSPCFLRNLDRVLPTIIIGKWTFDSNYPSWVRKMKDINVCCCIYHMAMEESRVGFNFMRKLSSIHIDGACTCHYKEVCGDGCQGRMLMFHGTTSKQESILWPINKFRGACMIEDVYTGNTINVEVDKFVCCLVGEQIPFLAR